MRAYAKFRNDTASLTARGDVHGEFLSGTSKSRRTQSEISNLLGRSRSLRLREVKWQHPHPVLLHGSWFYYIEEHKAYDKVRRNVFQKLLFA